METITTKHTVTVQHALDNNNYLFQQSASHKEVSITTFTRQHSGTLTIAASGTESIGFGEVTECKGFWLQVDAEAQLAINGGAAITLRPTSTVAKVFMEADITALAITNPSGTEALNAIFSIWGNVSS